MHYPSVTSCTGTYCFLSFPCLKVISGIWQCVCSVEVKRRSDTSFCDARSGSCENWGGTPLFFIWSLLPHYALQFRPKRKLRWCRRWRPQSQWTAVVCYPSNEDPSGGSGWWARTWQSTAAVRFPDSGIEPATSCPKEPELPGRRGVVGIRTAEVRRLEIAAKLKLSPGGTQSDPRSSCHRWKSWQLMNQFR